MSSTIFSTTSNNTKYIIMGVSLLSLLFIGYFFLSKRNTESGGSAGPKSCTFGIDDKGNCIQPEICGDDNIKPPTDCQDGQTLVCDPVLKKWRCKLSCESESNPFPNDFSYCQTKDIKCHPDRKYYCQSDYCQNGGVLYSTSDGKCTCPKYFSGDKCECDSSKCKDGSIDSKCDKCLSCCDKKTSVDNRCQYYGDNCDNKCDTNEVYYEDEQKCKCPLNSCFKNDDKGNCVHLQTSQCCIQGSVQDGVCICDKNSGWTGPNCDIPICGENGKWDKAQNKCICNLDDNGNPLAAGDKCEYTREKLCSGNGIPQYSNGIASCRCDSGYLGDHCTCINKEKPDELDIFKCEGIYSKCKETSNSDGTYSGRWVDAYKDCNSIYNYYQTQDLWESECTPVIFPNNPYPSYYARCEPKSIPDNEGINIFKSVGPTCFANPTEDQLKNCTAEGDKCYVSWNDKNKDPSLAKSFDRVCICEDKNDVSTYSCRAVTSEKECGPYPPLGFCIGPDGKPVNPSCVPCGNKWVWACDQSNIPAECLEQSYGLTSRKVPHSNKVWWYTREKDTVFPTINMDKCDSDPFNPLIDNKFKGYLSMNSAPGFVSGLGTSDQKFYNWDDDDIINYNVNADIDVTNGKININNTNPYPFPEESSKNLMFDYSYRAQVGCAKMKNQFDANSSYNTRCAPTIDENGNTKKDQNGKIIENGIFTQYCADINKNIIPCINPYYKTDKGHCECNKYYSNVQKNDVKYRGKYCQYSDNETCSGLGIVINDNGLCDYTGGESSFCCYNNCSAMSKKNCKDDKSDDCINCLNSCKKNPYGFRCL